MTNLPETLRSGGEDRKEGGLANAGTQGGELTFCHALEISLQPSEKYHHHNWVLWGLRTKMAMAAGLGVGLGESFLK